LKTFNSLRLAPLLLALAGGCGSGSPAAEAKPDAARTALAAALQAWKDGRAPSELQSASPKTIVVDVDWNKGVKLVDFKLEDSDEPYGSERRIAGTFTLATPKPAARKWAYLVGTQGPVTIRRDED
jgi:hypothetical protein